jgi:hypothetical protein
MTKSRIALLLLLLAPLLCWPPGTALAQPAPAPLSAEELVAAHNARILDAMGGIDGVARCPRGGPGDDAIVVCGRTGGARNRLPFVAPPEPGTPHRLIAGETPTGSYAMTAADPDRCVRLCEQPLTIPIIPAIRTLARGFGRILHPD